MEVPGKSHFNDIRLQLREAGVTQSLPTTIAVATDMLLIVDQVSGRCEFPLESFEALRNGFGGSSAAIAVRGSLTPLAALEARVPREFFPVASEDDLVRKLVAAYRDRVGFASGEGD